MNLNRRQIIKGIGAALCAGVVPRFVPELVGGGRMLLDEEGQEFRYMHNYDALHGFMRWWGEAAIKQVHRPALYVVQ